VWGTDVAPDLELDAERLAAAMRAQAAADAAPAVADERRRGYNSLSGNAELTAEEMEAYRRAAPAVQICLCAAERLLRRPRARPGATPHTVMYERAAPALTRRPPQAEEGAHGGPAGRAGRHRHGRLRPGLMRAGAARRRVCAVLPWWTARSGWCATCM